MELAILLLLPSEKGSTLKGKNFMQKKKNNKKQKNIQTRVKPQWLEHRWLVYHGWFELDFESLGHFSHSSRKQISWDHESLYYVYSFESHHWGDSNEYTQHTVIFCKIEQTSLNYPYPLPLDLALWLTLTLLFTTTPTFANSVDPDQMASEEAIWSGSTLFVIQFVNLNENIIWYIWLADSQKWVWLIKLFSKIRINSQWLKLPISRTNFHGTKDVRAIEVNLDCIKQLIVLVVLLLLNETMVLAQLYID